MKPDTEALPTSARTLYLALRSLRGRRSCVQTEARKSVRAWAVARGCERFDEDLSVLINRGLVIDLRAEGHDELQVLTPEQSGGAAVMEQAERDWPAHRERLLAQGMKL